MVGIPVLAKLALAAGDREVGILFGAFGAGALVGTLIAGGVPALPRPGAVLGLGVLGAGLATAAAGLAQTVWTAAAWLAMSGLLVSVGPVIGWTFVQTRTPAAMRGRVVALLTLSVAGLQPLALALAGFTGDALGPRTLLVAGGAIASLSGVYGLSRKALRDARLA
jgi:MFS family permease